jgi:hypothetical protein
LAQQKKINIGEKILKCDITQTPFPHIIIKNILGHSNYREMLNSWPDGSLFTTFGGRHDRVHGDPGRFGFYFMGEHANKHLTNLDVNKRNFWENFGDTVIRPATLMLYEKYLPNIRARFKEKILKLELETTAVMLNSYNRLELGIHSDLPNVLFKGLIYVNNGVTVNAGTKLYEVLDDSLFDIGTSFLDKKDCKLLFSVPFESDNFLSFFKTGNSFHGVDKIKLDHPNQRASINFQTILTPASMEKIYGDGATLDKFKNWSKDLKKEITLDLLDGNGPLVEEYVNQGYENRDAILSSFVIK